MSISVLLWDFGDTLVEERWMRLAPIGCATWESSWVDVMAELADAWNVGVVTSAIVFQALASHTGMSAEDVEAHARDCCRQIEFHPLAWRYAQKRCRPQALVTVNPDLFLDYVIPLYGLTAVFDEIIVSATEHCANKVEMCKEALARLGFAGDRSEALLIDNRADLVRAWEETGGAGYWFRVDEEFGRDLPVLLDEVR
jgi:FMN phosphatase YigB (HAD superfamily)